MKENVNEDSATQENNLNKEDKNTSKESFLKKLFPFLQNINFSFSLSSVIIPAAVVVLVLLLGGGGTYIVASNIFKNENKKSQSDQISQEDILKFSEVILPTPTLTPVPVVNFENSSSASVLTPTPNVMLDLVSLWIPYTFSELNLSFKYPPGWYVNVSSSSGPPSFSIQNFSPNSASSQNTKGTYAIQISRFPQVGITTVSQLTSQLAINEAGNVFINGVNMGLVTVINSGTKTVNGYLSYERTIMYSNNPFSQVYQLFILDGVSNVIQITPKYDTLYGRSYFNNFLTTISFKQS